MMLSSLWRCVRPPVGPDARRLVGLATLAVALPRLPFWPGPHIVYPLHLLPQEVFGWAALVSSLLLLATTERYRMRFVGRMSAVLAFAFWVTLAFATTSATSMMLDALFAYALFGEIIAQEKRGDE